MNYVLVAAVILGWGGAVLLSLVFLGYIGVLAFGWWLEDVFARLWGTK